VYRLAGRVAAEARGMLAAPHSARDR
jgi:hypothetical protein